MAKTTIPYSGPGAKEARRVCMNIFCTMLDEVSGMLLNRTIPFLLFKSVLISAKEKGEKIPLFLSCQLEEFRFTYS